MSNRIDPAAGKSCR